MPLFEVEKESKQVSVITPTTFPELKLWERQDLEAWVLSAPELAGGDFVVVTAEFDRFDKTSERLDILGIVKTEPGHGRLVVIELKRDGVSTTVDLQAIKYAAYVAAVQFSDVLEMYSRYHEVPEDEAEAEMLKLLEGSEDEVPIIDDTPRIVLLAGDFRPEVTTTVLWLLDNFGMDIRCIRLQPFSVGERILVNSGDDHSPSRGRAIQARRATKAPRGRARAGPESEGPSPAPPTDPRRRPEPGSAAVLPPRSRARGRGPLEHERASLHGEAESK